MVALKTRRLDKAFNSLYMKTFRYLSVVILLITTACSVEEVDTSLSNESAGVELEFTATCVDAGTRTTLIQDGTLPNGQPKMITWWSPSEEICIFYGASSGNKFTSTNTELVQIATFSGTLNAFTGLNESGDFNYFWGVYPYSAAVSCDGESVVATLADEQEAVAGSYANNTNITIAKSPGLSLGFYNVCSFLRFYVEKEGVISATFRGNNNEDVAGTFSVSFGNDGRPTAPVVTDGVKEIVLKRPNDEPFEVGTSYYFVILPQTFESGFTVQFDTETETGSRIISSSATFARNSINYGNTAFDHNVTYVRTAPANNEIWYTSVGDVVVSPNTGNYGFSASNIVSNTVEDGIGKIVFDYDLQTIPYMAFYRREFKTIRLPKSVTFISDRAIYECNDLEAVEMPQVTSIGQYNFYKCGKLKSITLPSTLTSIGVNCFYQCNRLEEATINTTASIDYRGLAYFFNGATLKTLKGPWATPDGKYVIIDNELVMAAGNGLESAIIPSGVTGIQPYVFYRYYSLKNAILPSTLISLGSNSFDGCIHLDYVDIQAENVPEWYIYGSNAFDNTNECPIIVPSESVTAYKEAWPQYSHRIGGSLEEVPTNLSKNGRANCYIVNSAGQFRFSATTKGNSNTEIDLYDAPSSTVEVLWESVLTPPVLAYYDYGFSHEVGTLISDIYMENGQIIFTATGNEGNALVAVRSTVGNIQWSWHLWFTADTIDEITNPTGTAIMMDRNLGAIRDNVIVENGYSSTHYRNTPSYGLYYQWGRKDPFVGLDEDLWTYDLETVGDGANRTQNPTTLYDNLSGVLWSTSMKDAADPCPPGWKVPSINVWPIMKTGSDSYSNSSDDANCYWDWEYNLLTYGLYCNSNWYPAAGRIYKLVDKYKMSGDGYYWAAADDTNATPYLVFLFDSDDGYLTYIYKHNGVPNVAMNIRCCKE